MRSQRNGQNAFHFPNIIGGYFVCLALSAFCCQKEPGRYFAQNEQNTSCFPNSCGRDFVASNKRLLFLTDSLFENEYLEGILAEGILAEEIFWRRRYLSEKIFWQKGPLIKYARSIGGGGVAKMRA